MWSRSVGSEDGVFEACNPDEVSVSGLDPELARKLDVIFNRFVRAKEGNLRMGGMQPETWIEDKLGEMFEEYGGNPFNVAYVFRVKRVVERFLGGLDRKLFKDQHSFSASGLSSLSLQD